MAVFKVISPISFFSVLVFFSACTVVKNHPVNKPFVYQTNVHVEGDLPAVEKKELALMLADQLHDSIRVKTVAKFASEASFNT